MSQPSPVIDVAGLRVLRGTTTIIKRIDWRVEPGQHWAILGPNGCGKTSLLSVLLGYLPATSGAIEVLGHTYGTTDWRDLRTRIGIVGASIANLVQADDLALDIVLGGLHAQSSFWGTPTPAELKEARRLLRDVEAAPLAGRPWRVLSQGERQRVLIGRALMARPALLLLDEPCAGLDPVAREHFLGFLQRLAGRSGCPAMALVTHHVEEIMPFLTHVLLLRRGTVQAAGPRRRVLTSANLEQTFGAPIRLRRQGERYALTIASASRGVV